MMKHVSFSEKTVFTILRKIQVWWLVLAVALILNGGTAYGQETTTKPAAKAGHNLGEIGAKLSNPASDMWAIFTEFDLTFSDGDLNQGDAKVGGRMIFQPIMPFPLYGAGDDEWRLITRPTLPVLFSTPVPKGFDDFNHLGGLGDTQLPMAIAPSKRITGNWAFALGSTWLIPTGTRDEFTKKQWGVGPAVLAGYADKHLVAGALLQYTWGIGGWNDDDIIPDASYGTLLYYFVVNLADAWQVGCDPTISYDDKATSGNKWNVPVGLNVSKTVKIGKVPVKFQVGAEYSVVSPDDFGQRFQMKFNVIPVIPGLVQNAIFGK